MSSLKADLAPSKYDVYEMHKALSHRREPRFQP